RPDRDRIGGSCRRITLTCDGEPVALGVGPVAEQPRRAAPFGVAAPQTRLEAPWLIGAPRSAPPTPTATGRNPVAAPPTQVRRLPLRPGPIRRHPPELPSSKPSDRPAGRDGLRGGRRRPG